MGQRWEAGCGPPTRSVTQAEGGPEAGTLQVTVSRMGRGPVPHVSQLKLVRWFRKFRNAGEIREQRVEADVPALCPSVWDAPREQWPGAGFL